MHNLTYWYLKFRKSILLSYFVMMTRILIGFAFIPSGLKKVLGLRFTTLPLDNPIGFFFEAMFRTGFYWNFLGLMQMLAAYLLMTQRFATIGAVIFFPLIINICLITIAMQFTGTWLITLLMTLACLMLLLWDLPKFYTMFSPDNFRREISLSGLPTYNIIWIAGGIILYIESIFLGLHGFPSGGRAVLIYMILLTVTTLLTAFFAYRYDKRTRSA